MLFRSCFCYAFMRVSSNGWHSGLKIFKPEKNLVFFQAKILRP